MNAGGVRLMTEAPEATMWTLTSNLVQQLPPFLRVHWQGRRVGQESCSHHLTQRRHETFMSCCSKTCAKHSCCFLVPCSCRQAPPVATSIPQPSPETAAAAFAAQQYRLCRPPVLMWQTQSMSNTDAHEWRMNHLRRAHLPRLLQPSNQNREEVLGEGKSRLAWRPWVFVFLTCKDVRSSLERHEREEGVLSGAKKKQGVQGAQDTHRQAPPQENHAADLRHRTVATGTAEVLHPKPLFRRGSSTVPHWAGEQAE